MIILSFLVSLSLFSSGSFAGEDYTIIEFETLPARITTNISAFPVTGRVPPDTNAVYVDGNEVYFDRDGNDVFVVVDLNDGNNTVTLKFVDQNDLTIKECSKQILFDPNHSTDGNELVYANCTYLADGGSKYDGIVVIAVREDTFLGIIKEHQIKGITRDGLEIILEDGKCYSTANHEWTGRTLPEPDSLYKPFFSHDGKFVYYGSYQINLDSNSIEACLPVALGPRGDITRDDQKIFMPGGYIIVPDMNFVECNYDQKVRELRGGFAVEPAGSYIFNSSYSRATGKLNILNAEDCAMLKTYEQHEANDYAGDIAFSPDAKRSYAGFYGNTWIADDPNFDDNNWITRGGILIIDANTLEVEKKFRLHGPRSLAVSKCGKVYASAFYTLHAKRRVGDPNVRGIVELRPINEGTNFQICKVFFVSLESTMYKPYYGSDNIFYKSRIIFVDCNATGDNDGSSWEDAFNYLQNALAIAESGDEVCVANGTYKPDQGAGQMSGDQTVAFGLKNGVSIKGGYAGSGEPYPNARDIEAYETILSGDLTGNDVQGLDPCDLLNHPSRAENSYHVVTGSGTEPNAILYGFTITAGNANGDESRRDRGGGVYNDGGNPTITCCTFISNSALNNGGGMYNEYSSPTLINCAFSGNSADDGGGMFGQGSNPMVSNCTFSNNRAVEGGGGMHNDESIAPTLNNCTFNENSADYGGGMFNYDSTPAVTDCNFSGNEASAYGGGMYNEYSSPMVTNCIFTSNSADDGGGMNNDCESNPIVTNCILSGNSADSGGGIYNLVNSRPTLANCIFSGNLAEFCGGGVNNNNSDPNLTNCTLAGNLALFGSAIACDSREEQYPSNLQVTNCILWNDENEIWNNNGSTITITYSNVQGGQAAAYDPCEGLIWGPGNIDADPCFVDLGHWEDPCNTPSNLLDDVWIDGDYHLNSNSPCINKGDPNYLPDPCELDVYGGHRFIVRIDIGADEYTPGTFSDLNNDKIVDYKDLAIFANNWLKNSCFEPNWCEASDIDRSGKVDLDDFSHFAEDWLWRQQPESIQWLVGQQNQVTGLLNSYEANGDFNAWLFDQTLAIIAFVEAEELYRARMILDRMKQLQLVGSNRGAWYQCYDSANLFVCDKNVITGPVAWMVIAINYYEYYTSDRSYAPMARNALAWLDTMRNTEDPNDERYGSLKFSPKPEWSHIISTEHNIDAYSGYYWRGMLDANDTYLDDANLILDYLRREMWGPTPGSNCCGDANVFCRGYNDCEVATDCPAWGVLALGPSGPGGEEFSESLYWLLDSTLRTVCDYNESITDVNGFKSETDEEPNYVRVDVTESVASAFYSIGDDETGDDFHNQMGRIISPNGGLVHSFSCEVSPDCKRWSDNYRYNYVASVAWYYFNEVKINPFNPQ